MKNDKRGVLVRVPREVQRELEYKLPNITNKARWQIVWDKSAIKLDNWLGKPIKFRRKRK